MTAWSPRSHRNVVDRDFLSEFYRAVYPFTSGKTGILLGAETLELVDGSPLQVVVLEGEGSHAPAYSVALPKPAKSSFKSDRGRTCKGNISFGTSCSGCDGTGLQSYSCFNTTLRHRTVLFQRRDERMDVFTLYVAQGSLVAVRSGNEAIIVDAHMPNCDGDVMQVQIERSLDHYLSKCQVRGLILTGLDKGPCVSLPASNQILYEVSAGLGDVPKKFTKDTDTAAEVFDIIARHVKRHEKTSRPLIRHSVRVDQVDLRANLRGLANHFTFELFSPHMDDMDSSNNSSIALKLTGT